MLKLFIAEDQVVIKPNTNEIKCQEVHLIHFAFHSLKLTPIISDMTNLCLIADKLQYICTLKWQNKTLFKDKNSWVNESFHTFIVEPLEREIISYGC